MDITGTPAAVITMEGMINKQVLAASVLNPLPARNGGARRQAKFSVLRDQALGTSEQVQFVTFEEAFQFAMSGFAPTCFWMAAPSPAIGIQGFSFRGIRADLEVMQRGSREGFVEPIRINITMIRRRIKTPS